MLKMTKAAQRRGALERRQAIPALMRRKKSVDICETIAELDKIKSAKTVMSYMAFGYEADMAALHGILRKRGVRLCFPVCAENGLMEAYSPEEEGAFVSGALCVSEPDKQRSVRIAPEEIDAVIVPCTAFDDTLMRIGQGAGYYDRFLPRCKGAFFVAAAFSVQQVKSISADSNDVPMKAVVTEDRVFGGLSEDGQSDANYN